MGKKRLNDLLAELHAERERTWDPAQLQLNVDQRRELVEAANPAAWPQVGAQLPAFELEEVDGERLTAASLTADGPAVLIFFRYAGCPACNIALPHYDRMLAPQLKALGARLVAVSPQVPERLVEIKQRHGLSFEVASDRDNVLGGKLGIVFTANAASQTAARAKGSFIGEVTGTGTWDLPQPAVVVLDGEGRVRFAEVSPDWLARTEAEPIVQAVKALALVAAE